MNLPTDPYLITAILVLGIARLVLILVRDDITLRLREFVFKHSSPEAEKINGRWDKNPNYDETQPVDGTNPVNVWTTDIVRAGWWGQVFSCPDCMGPYVATGALIGYYYLPDFTLAVMMVLAASMITSLIARKY